MGDFNAKVSKSRESPTVGIFGSKGGNDRGDRLIEIARAKNVPNEHLLQEKSWKKMDMEESKRDQK